MEKQNIKEKLIRLVTIAKSYSAEMIKTSTIKHVTTDKLSAALSILLAIPVYFIFQMFSGVMLSLLLTSIVVLLLAPFFKSLISESAINFITKSFFRSNLVDYEVSLGTAAGLEKKLDEIIFDICTYSAQNKSEILDLHLNKNSILVLKGLMEILNSNSNDKDKVLKKFVIDNWSELSKCLANLNIKTTNIEMEKSSKYDK